LTLYGKKGTPNNKNIEKNSYELVSLLLLLKRFFKAWDKVQTFNLSSEIKAILDAISFKQVSLKTGKEFLNIARCRQAIVLKILAGECVEDLYKNKEFDRSTVYRAIRYLLETQTFKNDNGRLIPNPEKIPGIYFLLLAEEPNA